MKERKEIVAQSQARVENSKKKCLKNKRLAFAFAFAFARLMTMINCFSVAECHYNNEIKKRKTREKSQTFHFS